MERPVSIVWFERCYLGALVLGVLNTALSWNTLMAQMAAQPNADKFGAGFGATVMIISLAIGVGISLLLWFLAARKHSVVAKWIITVFFVLGVLGLLFQIIGKTFPSGIAGVVTVVAWVLNLIAVYQLFKPDTEVWFGEKKPDQGGHVL
ncbi:hypothetical protein [Sphingomonas immobilis]|uniref:Uncharacterized protein n=1 Tax=Sphingomonas immobilis TaxID=3063997 RepID=A0ABT8ZU06_9SPHN|nr:hypothetical protein [Sphingomonas sp. CA1-15]MDO7841050.1 hypothetical protein [Sphingomonas sp. CA1-15]